MYAKICLKELIQRTSDEVRGKKAKENAVAYFQTNAAQPGQRWHKNRFAYTELSGRSESSVGFI